MKVTPNVFFNPPTIKSKVLEVDKYVIIEYKAISTPQKISCREKNHYIDDDDYISHSRPSFYLNIMLKLQFHQFTAPPLIDKPIPAPKKKPPKPPLEYYHWLHFGKSYVG